MYNNAQWIDFNGQHVSIRVDIAGATNFVPIALGNADYEAIMALVAAGQLTIQDAAPPEPTPMPTITAAQLRLVLLGLCITAATVETAINAMPGTDTDREAARIQWEYDTTFPRQHPLVVAIGAALGMTEAQIDEAWLHAATL